jgi:hypothetical protein
LEAARLNRDELDWFVSSTEAVLWLMVADELNWPLKGYRDDRDADPTGASIAGFRNLWNLIKHVPLKAVIDDVEGLSFPPEV